MTTNTEYRPGDLTTWSFDGLIKQLDEYRERQSKEHNDIVHTALQHKIDDIIAEIDRRNRERLAVH